MFRRVRHIPYSRIQNIDAVQNVLHRVLGVAEVNIETGGGDAAEAKMSVLPLAAFALGLVLFVVTLALNVIALHVVRKYREQYE